MIIEISKENGAILFRNEVAYYSFPDGTIMLIANDGSDAINVRLLGSRKNILTFNYQNVSNLTATSATDLVEQINNL